MIELDGSQGEGGGQILRTSLALSIITGQAFHLRNVRASRAKPGLQPQHLMSVKAAATISGSRTRGAELHSRDLVFEPGQVRPDRYHFAIGTAGSTGLVLHTLYLPLALAKGSSTLTIEGGTHVRTSPCFHFLDISWRAYMEAIDLRVKLMMHRPGFYPRGGGILDAEIEPTQAPRALQIERVDLPEVVHVLSAVAGLPASIAERQANQARQRLELLGLRVVAREEKWERGPGTLVGLTLPTSPLPTFFFALGERAKPAERVADEAVDQVEAFLAAEPAGIDEHSADQLVLPLSLAKGPSQFPVARVSSHLLTNIRTISNFLDRKIDVAGDLGHPGVVSIGGGQPL